MCAVGGRRMTAYFVCVKDAGRRQTAKYAFLLCFQPDGQHHIKELVPALHRRDDAG